MATLEEFKKLNLVVARILEVQEHPNADRLYVLKVDTGSAIRQVVAGIRLHYSPEALKGKVCIFIDNLEPATIRGVESQGMILATKDAQTLALLSPDREVALGSPVS